MLCRQVPLLMFHMRIWRSAVPPPLASRLGCQGHQAIAFRHTHSTTSPYDSQVIISPWTKNYISIIYQSTGETHPQYSTIYLPIFNLCQIAAMLGIIILTFVNTTPLFFCFIRSKYTGMTVFKLTTSNTDAATNYYHYHHYLFIAITQDNLC